MMQIGMAARSLTALALLTLLTLAGCVTTRRAPSGSGTVPAARAPERFHALYRIRAQGPDGRVRGRAWVAVDAPRRRIAAELLGPTGGTRAQLDASADHTLAYLTEEHAYLEEPTSPRALGAAFGVPVGLEDLIAVLRGRRPDGGRTPPVQLETEGAGVWSADWRFEGDSLPSGIVFEGPRGRLEMSRLRLTPDAPMPEAFRPPPEAVRHDPESFRALFLP